MFTAAAAAVATARPEDAGLTPARRVVAKILTAAELADLERDLPGSGAIRSKRLLADRSLRQIMSDSGEPAPASLSTKPTNNAEAIVADKNGLIDALRRQSYPSTPDARASAFVTGPVLVVKSLRAQESWAFDVEARDGEILRVAAIGDGDTNIDLTVRDESGTVVCRDGFGDHYPVCTIPPRIGGRMHVDVINRGDVWTRVQVLSN